VVRNSKFEVSASSSYFSMKVCSLFYHQCNSTDHFLLGTTEEPTAATVVLMQN